MIIFPALSMGGGLLSNLFVLAIIAVWSIIYPALPPCLKHAYPSLTDDGDYKMDKVEFSRLSFHAEFSNSLGQPIKPEPSEPTTPVQRPSLRHSRSAYFETLGEQSDHGCVHEEFPYQKLQKKSSNQGRNSASIPEDESVEQKVQDLFESLCDDADVGMTQKHMERLLAVWGLPYR